MRKNIGHFLPTAFGVIRLYVWQIALLLLQQDLLTISIRAHGGESSQGMLVMEKPDHHFHYESIFIASFILAGVTSL